MNTKAHKEKKEELLAFCINCKRNIPESFSHRREDLRASICHKDPYYSECMKLNGFKLKN